MSPVRDFVANLARARKTTADILSMTEEAFGEKSISKSQVNRIKKLVREGEDTTSMRARFTQTQSAQRLQKMLWRP